MPQQPTAESALDIKEVMLGNASFGPKEIERIHDQINADFTQLTTFRDALSELEVREDRSPAMAVRLGVGYYLLGRFESAIQVLQNADGGALALFYLGKAHLAKNRFDEALGKFEEAKSAGYSADVSALARAEALRTRGQVQEAMDVLDQLFGPIEQTADYLYHRGATVAALGGNPGEVIALYERAVDTNPHHAGALFGLALENDRRGNDGTAMELYQRAVQSYPAHVGSLLNLGILYEDHNDFARAHHCYERILSVYPNHPRASMFLKDAAASGYDAVDEDSLRMRDKLSQKLNIPVTEFEMSVRARNCLKAMGIRTLGDLTRVTEQELLSSKNFGETSLEEIREIMVSKGLKMGQFANERVEPEPAYDVSTMSPDEQALLDRPISDLNLSVRARKCMVRLGLTSVGELLRRTGDDLLECKNFGVTSLNEVREKLAQYNLKLRGE